MKPLISAILLSIALTSNGAGSMGASGRQELRKVQAGPSTADSTSAVTEPGEPGEEVREEFHQTYPLSLTGRVSLENINGDVQIKVWDRAAVQVDAVKKAYRKDRLAEATIEVNATEENIRIKTEYPDGPQNFRGGNGRWDNPATVDYTLTVPRKAVLESVELVNGSCDIDGVEGNVKASSINGRLNARGLMGEARLSTINGPLNASFNQLDESKPISLGSVNGNVTLIIPSNSNASVKAGTVHGGISTDFTLKVKHGEYVGHSMDGQIGTGGPRIKLGNVNGGIKVSRAQDGLPLSPAASIQGEAAQEAEKAVDVDVAVEVGENVRVNVDTARIARQAQRQVDAAMREAQREIERAQRDVVRDQARQQRVVNISRGRSEGYNPRVTAKETRTFAVTGSPRVTLNTFDGEVTVRGWDKQEISYTATKAAHDEESLKGISIQSQQQGEAVSITATNNESENGSVSFDVYVPRQSTLHVSSGDGALNLEGVKGQITLRSGDGPIQVSNGGGQLQVNTGDGVIRVIKFEGQVDARTGDGEIALDGNFNAVSARTGDGTISLSVPAGSSFTIETNAPDEISNEGFTVAEDITPSPRVKRWRIGNGGKVFILKTGDGKILLRPRQ
ncbi:MAG TPA: DUF4097 family beta strand repeat-containing protein [Pyrinomonadaceae bacterium]|jgi:DUF4097 and DUF4098 domain-containing protein YvlB|nr:DUF4097 family beta strand repeat-containing protein [Pyrinomonadaceae bacterium]